MQVGVISYANPPSPVNTFQGTVIDYPCHCPVSYLECLPNRTQARVVSSNTVSARRIERAEPDLLLATLLEKRHYGRLNHNQRHLLYQVCGRTEDKHIRDAHNIFEAEAETAIEVWQQATTS